ncbi:MAG TPA: nucleotidyltransferase domain-containing protein [Candidatus Parabacteroides intestinigallinarum]|uniref:Nucleotidyltransferase domain-containing protein n=1 Tax=Candidatus Parabacteroides intestinigallinarum TaxID=2838722 RepID=A0A9D2BPU2_9BACT|nr:nucleotidyltransferase domain-containing protein [Candidatus Parabacteroides intestinigallinarum]
MVESANVKEGILGLSPRHMEIIQQILKRCAPVSTAVIFGSRAKGTYKSASDIDLAIKGTTIGKNDVATLREAFEESLLPFFVDVISYDSIQNQALKEHIDRVGIPIYQR